jgi:hypothetical protein
MVDFVEESKVPMVGREATVVLSYTSRNVIELGIDGRRVVVLLFPVLLLFVVFESLQSLQ